MLLSKSDKFDIFEEVTDELIQHIDRRIDSYRLKKINDMNSNINTNEMRYFFSIIITLSCIIIIIFIVLMTKNR
jgi:hypothetical protein